MSIVNANCLRKFYYLTSLPVSLVLERQWVFLKLQLMTFFSLEEDLVTTWVVDGSRAANCWTQESNHYQFDQPLYQKTAVDAYLRTLPKGTYADLFNPWAIFHCSIWSFRGWLCILLTEMDEWGPNIQISLLRLSLTIKISGLSGCCSTRK